MNGMAKVIAEAGLNHNGAYGKAAEMISAAKTAGADIVKFQFYYPDMLCLNRNDFSAYRLLDKIKMHPSWIPLLSEECGRLNIEFLVTAFCKFSVQEIEPYVKRFKIASPEAASLEFVKMVAEYGKPLIISTGKIGDRELDKIFKNVTNDITLLVCVARYPAQVSDYDLNEIDRLRKRYQAKVGVSCHCAGIKNAIDAVKFHNADIVEKHFKIDDSCVDAAVSLWPDDFAKMTKIIKEIGRIS